MNRYLIAEINPDGTHKCSYDSSHRPIRFTVIAENLEDLNDQLTKSNSQMHYIIMASEKIEDERA
jgi:YD repeat-containing protein